MDRLEALSKSLIEGQKAKVQEIIRMALAEGITASEILNKGLLGGMNVVGERFRQAEMFIPEVLLAAEAMEGGMEILKTALVGTDYKCKGKIVLGTARGDIHDVGKNLVGIMFNGAGFEVIDLGVNVPSERFIEVARREKAQLIGISALLTITMPNMKNTIEELNKAGLKNKVKTIVGGATVTQRYADEIGADGYAPDASSAVNKVKELLGLS